jgi:hypothetical protein
LRPNWLKKLSETLAQKTSSELGMVACAYNSRYSGDRDLEDRGLRAAQVKKFERHPSQQIKAG